MNRRSKTFLLLRILNVKEQIIYILLILLYLMLQPVVSGWYTFFMTCEDECELWINEANEPILNDEGEMDQEGELTAKLPTRTGLLKWDE